MVYWHLDLNGSRTCKAVVTVGWAGGGGRAECSDLWPRVGQSTECACVWLRAFACGF